MTFIGRRYAESRDLYCYLRSHWVAVACMLGVYVAAQHWIGVNVTQSLPYHLVWMDYGRQPIRGDLVVFRFSGTPMPRYGYLRGAHFFKRVAGLPGDNIRVENRSVYVGEQLVGWAKSHTVDGVKLDPIAAGEIPSGHFFAQSDSIDSFDSRYAQSGLVPLANVIAVARVIF